MKKKKLLEFSVNKFLQCSFFSVATYALDYYAIQSHIGRQIFTQISRWWVNNFVVGFSCYYYTGTIMP